MIPVVRRSAFRFHQKAEFIRGADLKPEPPVTPVAMGKATRGVEPKTVSDLDEKQVAAWIAGCDDAVRERSKQDEVVSRLLDR